jgi:hypothetical protein
MYPIIAALLLGATPAGPLTAANPVADRGEFRTGPQLAQVFELRHAGPAGDIVITNVETGCGCLKPTLTRTVLHPGDRAELTLTVNTLTQPPGANTWRAVVHYRTDSRNFDLELRLTAKLIREISVTPPMLAVSTAGAATQSITVTDRRAAPLAVRTAATTNPHLTATVHPATTADGVRTQTITVAVAADYPAGRFDETLTLVTTDPTCRELRVPIRVTRREPGAVKLTPDSLDVRFARGRAEASGLVQLRRPGGGSLRVERVECENPAVRARWAATAGPVATVRVIVTAAKADGRAGKAAVRVILAEPAGASVVLPISWALPDAR